MIGISDLPDTARVQGIFCTDDSNDLQIADLSLEPDFANARREHTFLGSICTVSLNSYPRIAIDTVIVGGPATVADFSYDIIDSGSTTVATAVVDPAAATCTLGSPDANCSDSRLVEGTYSLAANAVADSYVLTSWVCDNGSAPPPSSAFGPFTHSTDDLTPTLCTVTYSYATQDIAVDVVVINDNGGTAAASDFTIEVRDAANNVVATGTDPEPGTGNASAVFTLPLGEYTITATGPAGYEITVEVTVVDRPADVTVAGFNLSATESVTAVVTANDPAPTTTTSQPTTTTTIFVAVLPETGSSDTTAPLALIAALLTLFGAGAVYATRRS